MSDILAIESFLEITLLEGIKSSKKEKCKNCPFVVTLKELLSETKKEKLLRINEKF